MSKENEELDLAREEVEQDEKPKLSPTKEKALTKGWMTQEDWVAAGKDPDEWVDAKSYIDRGEMMDRIKKQNTAIDRYKGELETAQAALKALGDHNRKIAKIERDKVVAELKREKAKAIRDDDAEAIVEIDEQLLELKQEEKEDKVEAKQDAQAFTQEQAIVQEWLDDPENEWYHQDWELHEAADSYFRFLTRGKKKVPVEQALKDTVTRMKEKYPDKFDGEPSTEKKKSSTKVRDAADDTSEKGGGKGAGKKYTARDLDDATLRMAKEMVRAGAFKNVQEYVDQLKETGYFK